MRHSGLEGAHESEVVQVSYWDIETTARYGPRTPATPRHKPAYLPGFSSGCIVPQRLKQVLSPPTG